MSWLLRAIAFLLLLLAGIAAWQAKLDWNAHALAYFGLAAYVLSGFPFDRVRQL